jgi:hypothetical protein
MKRHSTPLIALAFVAAAILPLAPGCKKKPPTMTEEARPPVEQPAPPETRVSPPPPSVPAGPADVEVTAMPLDDLNKKGYLQDAYFDYDQSDLRDDARAALSANAEWLKRFTSIQILIEGHADERLPRFARRRRVARTDGLVRQGAAVLHRLDRRLLAAEPPRPLRHHRQVA